MRENDFLKQALDIQTVQFGGSEWLSTDRSNNTLIVILNVRAFYKQDYQKIVRVSELCDIVQAKMTKFDCQNDGTFEQSEWQDWTIRNTWTYLGQNTTF